MMRIEWSVLVLPVLVAAGWVMLGGLATLRADEPNPVPAAPTLRFVAVDAAKVPAEVVAGFASPSQGVWDQCGNRWSLVAGAGAPDKVTVMVSNDPSGGFKPVEGAKPLPIAAWSMLRVDAVSFVWVSDGNRLCRLDPRKPEASWVEYPVTEKLGGKITAMCRGAEGLILVGTEGGGIFEVDFMEKGEAIARRCDLEGLGVKGQAIPALYVDNDGAVWVSAKRNGSGPGVTGSCYRAAPAANAWQKHWEELPNMPFGSHDVFGAELGGKLYIPGGMANHGLPARYTYFPEMFIFDPSVNQWSMTKPMAKALCYSGVAVMEGKVWVVGGAENQEADMNKPQKRVPVDLVHVYDPAKGTWEMGPSLPEGRMESVVTAVNGRVYCCIGVTTDAKAKGMASALSIGPGETSWRVESKAPPKGGQSSGCVLGGVIYIASSQGGLISFDPASGKWDTSLPKIPSDKVPAAALCAAHKGEVWVMGGYGTKTPQASWRYNPKTKQWTAGPDLPTSLCWGAAAEVKGQLLIAGGGYGSHGAYIFPNRAYRLRE